MQDVIAEIAAPTTTRIPTSVVPRPRDEADDVFGPIPLEIPVPVGRIALAHDYLTQQGGAERVAEVMTRAFPGAPLVTTLYEPDSTFPELRQVPVRTSALNRAGVLRHYHRLALPLLAPAVSQMTVEADVLLASSSGWAHGIHTTGRKVVYCHAPARWLYQADRYLGAGREMSPGQRARRQLSAAAVRVLGNPLRSWDRRAAGTADRYLVNSTIVQRAVAEEYGIEAEVLPPPPAMMPAGPESPVAGIDGPYLLCVARLLPYKNVDHVIRAALELGVDLVVVGDGPDRSRLAALAAASPRVRLVGRVTDEELRWLYAHSRALVAASFEDFGLSPLEAAAFGRPTVALHDGGFLDTVVEGRNGTFFAEPEAGQIAAAITRLGEQTWDDAAIRAHAESFGERRFVQRLREIVTEELALR